MSLRYSHSRTLALAPGILLLKASPSGWTSDPDSPVAREPRPKQAKLRGAAEALPATLSMEAPSSLKAMKGVFRLLKSHRAMLRASANPLPCKLWSRHLLCRLTVAMMNLKSGELKIGTPRVRMTISAGVCCIPSYQSRTALLTRKHQIPNACPLQLALETLHGTPPAEQATLGSMLV